MQCPKISFFFQRWCTQKGWRVFLVSKVCTLYHCCDDLPFDVEVLLCSNLKNDLCKLNLVSNSFSVSPIQVSRLFKVVSVTVAVYTTHLVRHLPASGQEFFCRSYILCYLDKIFSFCAVGH